MARQGHVSTWYEVDPDSVKMEERMIYAGEGQGSYQQVSNMRLVGSGQGNYNKETVVVKSGHRLSMGGMGCIAIFFILGFFALIGYSTNWIPLNYPYVAGVGFLFLFAYVLLIGTLGAWWPTGAGMCGGAMFLFCLCLFITMGNMNNWWQPAGAAPILIGAGPMALRGAAPANACGMLTAMATLAQKQLCCNQGWKNFCQSSPSADTVHTVHTVYHLHHAVPSSTVIHSTVHSVPSSVIASGASDLNSVHWHPDGFHTVRSSEDVVHGASSYGVSHPTATHFN